MLVYMSFTVAFEDAEVQKKDNMSIKTISESKGLTLYGECYGGGRNIQG